MVLPESEAGEWKRGGGSLRCVFLQDNRSFGWVIPNGSVLSGTDSGGS